MTTSGSTTRHSTRVKRTHRNSRPQNPDGKNLYKYMVLALVSHSFSFSTTTTSSTTLLLASLHSQNVEHRIANPTGKSTPYILPHHLSYRIGQKCFCLHLSWSQSIMYENSLAKLSPRPILVRTWTGPSSSTNSTILELSYEPRNFRCTRHPAIRAWVPATLSTPGT